MEFEVTTVKSVSDMMRLIGYSAAPYHNDGEFSYIKKIGGNSYPRFHLYIKDRGNQRKMEDFIFSLHLDQKKPSYDMATQTGGYHKHSGEYEGPVIKAEAERIRHLLSNNNKDF